MANITYTEMGVMTALAQSILQDMSFHMSLIDMIHGQAHKASILLQNAAHMLEGGVALNDLPVQQTLAQASKALAVCVLLFEEGLVEGQDSGVYFE